MTKRLAAVGFRAADRQHRLHRRLRHADHLLHGERAAAPGARPGADGRRPRCWRAAIRVECGAFLLLRGLAGDLPRGARQHLRSPLGALAHIVARRGRRGASSACACSVSAPRAWRRRSWLPSRARRSCLRPARSTASAARSERPHPQPARRAASPWTRKAAARKSPFCALVGADQHRRHHPVQLLHGFGSSAASATRTSTSSGRARCTTSPRSTTSSTGSRSSTCRTWSARSRANGAPAATITRSSSTAASTGRSRIRSTRPKRRPAWLHVVPLHRARGQQMGNGGFTIEYPPLHELATSKNQYIRAIDHFLTYLNPEAAPAHLHEAVHARGSAGFCSSCHKVHLDVPVNNYRWFRGFNDYDNWQASGVSGQGARSFYYPPKTVDLRRLPHAAGRLAGSGQSRRQGPLAPLPGRQHGGGRTSIRTRRR